MKTNLIQKLSLGLLAVSALALTACSRQPELLDPTLSNAAPAPTRATTASTADDVNSNGTTVTYGENGTDTDDANSTSRRHRHPIKNGPYTTSDSTTSTSQSSAVRRKMIRDSDGNTVTEGSDLDSSSGSATGPTGK